MENKLFIKNLPADIQEEEVRYIFSKYGEVVQVQVVVNVRGDVAINYRNCALAPVELHIVPATKSKDDDSTAFVTYRSPEEAATAMRVLDGVYRVRSSSKEPIGVRIAYPDALPEPPPTASQTELSSAQAQAFAAAAATPRVAAVSGFSNGPTSATFKHVAEKAKCKLFVGNLYPEITQQVLAAVFGTWGNVVHVHIKTGKSRFGSACAFVELAAPEQAEAARQALHQKFDPRIGGGGAPIQVTFFQSGGKR